MKILKSLLLTLLVVCSSFKGEKYKIEKHVGIIIPDFSLRNTDSTMISFSSFPQAKGFIVVFTCNHCPFAKLYPNRLNALNAKYSALDIPLLAINSMDTAIYEEESFENMIAKAKNEKFNFPYLYDVYQTVGKSFKADHTPHAFILWKVNNTWVIKYSGAIDDNGEQPEKATSFIEPAIQSLLRNEPIKNPETNSFGCRIYYR